MGESDVILTCNEPTEKASKCSKSWRGNSGAHLASKKSKAGLHGEAQSRLRGGADKAGDGAGEAESPAWTEPGGIWGHSSVMDTKRHRLWNRQLGCGL